VNRNSLLWPCNRKTRLLVPYIIYCKSDTSVKFGYSITNVIKFESETSAATVADKVARFNESSRRMIEDGSHGGTVLPKIIFLYDRQTRVSVEELRRLCGVLGRSILMVLWLIIMMKWENGLSNTIWNE